MQGWFQESQDADFNPVMDVKNKKGFFSYIRQKGQAKESVPPR